jgi:hypothetical protein
MSAAKMDVAQSTEHMIASSSMNPIRLDSKDHFLQQNSTGTSIEDDGDIVANNLANQLASQFARYELTQPPPYYSSDNYTMQQSTSDVIDRSAHHDVEKVIEVSPNGRYARLNTLLGKGAYKIVYKGIDREEGYEVAWNIFSQVNTMFSFLVIGFLLFSKPCLAPILFFLSFLIASNHRLWRVEP